MASWPSVAWELHPWDQDPLAQASRRARRASVGPYRACVPPSIAELPVELDAETLAEADDAARELARFDAECAARPLPLEAILLRTESASSSEIERITAGSRQIALAELGASGSANARLVVANSRAMAAARRLAETLDGDAILAMHKALLGDQDPAIAGRWRQEQVWIGGGSLSPHSAEFVPPHRERVPGLVDDLAAFMARTDVPPLAHVAVAHAQFETIHPFPDGNGRTGRALAHALLRADDVVRRVDVPLSAGLLARPGAYFDALTAYRAGSPAPIVGAFAESAFRAIENGRRLADDLDRIAAEWRDRIPTRGGSAASRAHEVLFSQPVVSVELLARELGVSFPAASAAIDRFVEHGALRLVADRRRNRLWQADSVLDALDAFAARARRGRA